MDIELGAGSKIKMESQITEGEVKEEAKFRWNVKSTSSGKLYFEFTVRGQSLEEVKELALKSKKELEEICQ